MSNKRANRQRKEKVGKYYDVMTLLFYFVILCAKFNE